MTKIAAPLVAGRELDAMIAEKVMGLVPCTAGFHRTEHQPAYCHAHPGSPEMGAETAQYSISISDAWEVVRHFEAQETPCVLSGFNVTWACSFGQLAFASATSAPLAICLAALTTVSLGSTEP